MYPIVETSSTIRTHTIAARLTELTKDDACPFNESIRKENKEL